MKHTIIRGGPRNRRIRRNEEGPTDPRLAPPGSIGAAILDALVHGSLTRGQIVRAVGARYGSVNRAMEALQRAGKIYSPKWGVWCRRMPEVELAAQGIYLALRWLVGAWDDQTHGRVRVAGGPNHGDEVGLGNALIWIPMLTPEARHLRVISDEPDREPITLTRTVAIYRLHEWRLPRPGGVEIVVREYRHEPDDEEA